MSWRLFRLMAAGLVVLAPTPQASAQAPPLLTGQFNAGNAQLNVTGDAGSPVTVQFATNLSSGTPWLLLTNLTLRANPALLTDPAGAALDQRFYRTVIVVPTNMAWVPAGTFVMGSPTNEVLRNTNEVPHTVTLTNGFFMGRYPVTQGNYRALMNVNPAYYNTNNGFSLDLNRPVEQVSWSDATNYCGKLTQQERAAGRIFTNWIYRLPTEAEWEYACRAGTATPVYYGPDLTSGMANFNGQFEYIGGVGQSNNPSGILLNRTTTVGSYPPNNNGLFDMAGNVWEWCQDWFGSYATNSVTNPQGPAAGSARVFRGGALNVTGKECRSAYRSSYDPSLTANTVGFRVVLSSP